MVSLIKNQLLKHLSIYTKNLSSDKINLSTFRGEGELSNLQLDEAVLTELLELPSWLRLTSAWCNHVSFRISWTKLKSVPITLTLDEVNITVETCDPISRSNENKSPNGVGSGGGSAGGGSLPQAPQGKYSFIHKVVDGITIIVNTVNVKFLSTAFTASVQMSRIRVESKTPKWANADLRFTRLKDSHRGIILIFKELSWQTVRIEASSTQDKSLTPLRLLTNHARCRITIRKRLSDCTLLASRLVLILDDLLWVLTDSQLKAALHFVDSLSGLIKSATAATQKSKAARKLETLPEYQAQLAQQQNRQSESSHANNQLKMFNAFDVRETSYHFFSQRIDLHLCDDEGENSLLICDKIENELKMERKMVKYKKRNRSDNWIQEDRTLLKELVKERLVAIENKNTDSLTNQRKKKAWLDLEKRFNSLCRGEERNVFQLKSQWTVIKIQAKREAAEQRKELCQTNGGPPREFKLPVLSQTVTTNKLKILADVELKNREELHAIQMENERKRSRNLDLEYEILMDKKMFYKRKLNDGRSSYPELDKGGALQISVQAFQVDYYPYHLAKSDRSHWAKYKEASVSPALWLKESLNAFREAVINLSQPNRPSSHAPLERSTPNSPITLNPSALANQFASKSTNPSSTGSSTPTQLASNAGSGTSSGGSLHSHYHPQTQQHKTVIDNLAKLMSSCVILRIEDFQLYRVTTSGKKQMPKEFMSGDKDRYSFPAEMPILHAEFTYFYYPGDFIFPLPPSKVFVHINPLQLHFDLCSILWLNSFALNLHESLLRTSIAAVSPTTSTVIGSPSTIGSHGSQSTTLKGSSKLSMYNEPENEPSLMYMDVKVEAIMPRIVIESSVDTTNQKDRPKMMQIQISRFALTNIREMGSSRADLAQALHSLQEGSLVFGTGFPSVSGDMCIVTDRILSHVAATDAGTAVETAGNNGSGQRSSIPNSNSLQCLSRYAMWSEPRDVWCIKLDPVWIDFLGARSLGTNKSIPFVDAVPITLWLHAGSGAAASTGSHSNGDSRKEGSGDSNSVASTTKAGNSSIETNINRLDYANSNVKLPKNPFLDSEEDIHMDRKSQTSSEAAERTADLHAIAHISNLVSVQIDHYQLLFLLRLGEELNEMSTFLSLDAERILQKQNTKKSLIFGCVIPQIEVTFVMPSPTPGKESSGGDAESVLPDSASLGDDLLINSANMAWPTPPLEQIKSNTLGSVETPSPVTNEAPYDNSIHTSNPNTHGCNVQIQNSSTMASTATSQTSSTKPDTGVFTQSVTSSMTKSNRSTRNSTSETPSITKEINSGLMSMKKGFSSFMTSIDSAITSRTPNDDMSDTFSIQSDMSSDSENFAIVMGDDKTMDCIDVMFRLNPFTNDGTIKASPVEVASEVYEEPIKSNLSSPSEPSEASTWRRRDLVSMVTFRLTTVEVIRQQEGNNSTLRVQVAAVQCDECGAIPWDELQSAHQANKTKFGARCKAWNLAPYNAEAPPCIRLRLEETIKPPKDVVNIVDKKTIQNWVSHHADIRASDISLDLSMSTVIGLADLAEDEVISTNILPLNVTVENVRINLIEDRPPVNITSPGPVPINLAIGRMHLKRDKTGLLHIQPIETNLNAAGMANYPLTASLLKTPLTSQRERERDRELLSLQLIMQQIKMDNDNLRKQLQSAKENSESYRQKSKQETDVLRSYLKAAQDDISILLEEKKALLDTIRSLQLQVASMSMNSKKNEGSNR